MIPKNTLQEWQQQTKKQYKQELEAWKAEMPEFAQKARTRYLKAMIKEYTQVFHGLRQEYLQVKRREASWINDWLLELIEKQADRTFRKIQSCKIQLEILKGTREDTLTDDMIQRAREYPIERILGIDNTRRLVQCIAHDDKHPSMSIAKNFAHCFSCGYTADTIAVYRHLNSCGFKEAVLALQ